MLKLEEEFLDFFFRVKALMSAAAAAARVAGA